MEPCPQFGGTDLAIDIYPWPTHHDYKGTKSWSTFTGLDKCAGVLGKEEASSSAEIGDFYPGS